MRELHQGVEQYQEEQFRLQIHVLVAAPLLSRDHSSENGFRPVHPLAVWAEAESIYNGLRDANCGYPIDIQITVATTARVFSAFTNPRPPLILHFAGHGEPDGLGMALVIEDQTGVSLDVSAGELNEYLQVRTGPPCRIAVISACYSERLAEVLLLAGVEHVIAINANFQVLDDACRQFSRIFYPLLFESLDVRQAFLTAQLSVRKDYERRRYTPSDPTGALTESLKFRHIASSAARHELSLERAGDRVRLEPPFNTNLAPVSSDPFIGRQIVLHNIAEALQLQGGHRLINLRAMGGMGKTAIALAAARWHHERDLFREGAWMIELRNATSADEIVTQLMQVLPRSSNSARIIDLLLTMRMERHLFVLDDLDRLIERDSSGLVAILKLLLSLPNSRILTTSRTELPSEILHLDMPVEKLDRSEAIEAFRQFAGAGQLDLSREEGVVAFNWVMDFLGGYAFPIRLAASYLRRAVINIGELAKRLADTPRVAFEPEHETARRENSLRATLDISFSVLSASAREALFALGVFPGGISIDLIEYLDVSQGERAFRELEHFSMTEVVTTSSERRYQVPEPARDFVFSKSPPNVLGIYAPLYLKFCHTYLSDEPRLGPERIMTQERRNVYRILEYSLKESTDEELQRMAVYTVASLASYWQGHGLGESTRGIDLINAGLSVSERLEYWIGLAQCSKCLGDFAASLGSYDEALGRYNASFDAYRKAKDLINAGYMRQVAGDMLMQQGALLKASDSYAEAARYFREGDVPGRQAGALQRQAAALLLSPETKMLAVEPLLQSAEVLLSVDDAASAEALYKGAMLMREVGRTEFQSVLRDAYSRCPREAFAQYELIALALIDVLEPSSERASIGIQLARWYSTVGLSQDAAIRFEQAGDDSMLGQRDQAKSCFEHALSIIPKDAVLDRDRLLNKIIDAAC